jgi:RNA polymerase sigma factor (sigma-70 family)
MASGAREVVRRIEGLYRDGSVAGMGEGTLLERFVTRGDGAAFEAIVARHGPMVWTVCRQVLHDPNDAEDAFQATFLVLARRAGSIRERERLGGWLHGVACKVAARARRDVRQRPTSDISEPGLQGPSSGPSPDEDALRRERLALLHEELERLPGKYRDPIVLCHLEGCTHDEAAGRLGWPVGTVRGRLSRGRDRLRDRLSRRGLGLASALPHGLIEEGIGLPTLPFGATDPVLLTESTVKAAMRVAAGQDAAGVVSSQVAAWAKGVGRAMMLQPVKLVPVVILAGGLIAVGAGALALGQTHDAAVAAGSNAGRHEPATRKAGPAATEPEQADDDVKDQLRKVAQRLDEEMANEREARKMIEAIAGKEAEAELLRIEVEDEKRQLLRLMEAVSAVRARLNNPAAYKVVGKAPNPEARAQEIDDLARARKEDERLLELSRARMNDLKNKFIKDRKALSSLEMEQAFDRQKMEQLSRSEPSRLAPGVERRLAEIEAAVKEIRDEIRKPPR